MPPASIHHTKLTRSYVVELMLTHIPAPGMGYLRCAAASSSLARIPVRATDMMMAYFTSGMPGHDQVWRSTLEQHGHFHSSGMKLSLVLGCRHHRQPKDGSARLRVRVRICVGWTGIACYELRCGKHGTRGLHNRPLVPCSMGATHETVVLRATRAEGRWMTCVPREPATSHSTAGWHMRRPRSSGWNRAVLNTGNFRVYDRLVCELESCSHARLIGFG